MLIAQGNVGFVPVKKTSYCSHTISASYELEWDRYTRNTLMPSKGDRVLIHDDPRLELASSELEGMGGEIVQLNFLINLFS
jgi:hypothetical protein